MSSIRVSGNTSGHYDLTVPDVAGSNTIALDKIVVADSSGNVGIGVTSPNNKLEVDGTIAFSKNGTSGNRWLIIEGADGTYAGTMNIQAGFGSNAAGGAIKLYAHQHATYPGSTWIGRSAGSAGNIMFGNGGTGPSSASQIQVVINPSGNLGIGTTNPNKELTVNGNAHVGSNSSSIPNTSLASNLDFLQVGASTFIQAGADAQSFIKANHYWNGSGTSYVNTSYGSTTVRLNENNDGKFQIETAPAGGTGTTPRLIINNAGAVTKPYQPHWLGTNNNSYTTDSTTWITHGSGNNGGAGTGILKFPNVYSSSGSEWNGQRYTATVAGLYYFDLTLDILNGATIVFNGLKNGGRFHDEERIANLGTGWWNYNYSGHVYLNVNDYFEVSLPNGTWNNIAGGVWSKFGIRLVL
jgi:hypothetical protein